MPNAVDGIKKISKEELERSRQIVLASIGENKERPADKTAPPPARTVDSILSKTIRRPAEPPGRGKEPAVDFLSAKAIVLESPAPGAPADQDPPKENRPPASRRPAAAASKAPQPPRSKVNPFNNQIVEAKIKEAQEQDRRKQAEAARLAEIAGEKADAKRREQEKNRRLEAREREKQAKAKQALEREMEAQEKIKRALALKQAKAARKAARKEAQADRRRRRREAFSGMKQSVLGALAFAAKSWKNSIRTASAIIFFGLVLGVMAYAALLVVVIEYRLDNRYLRFAAAYVPLPAYVSQDGIVEFYDYLDIRKSQQAEFQNEAAAEQATKARVVEAILVRKLQKKYSLPAGSAEDTAQAKEILSDMVMADSEINQVGLTRINKIKSLIEEDGDFVKVANKYGDSQDKVTLTPNGIVGKDNLVAHYAPLSGLATGAVSDIMHDRSGYYIYRCFDRRGDSAYLSYVYVKGRSLEEYLFENISKYRLWSLVD